MKIEMNVFEKHNSQKKNGRTMKTVLAFVSDITCGGYSCMHKRRYKKRGTEYQRRSDGS